MEKQNNESGSIMVEAAIIFPMVLLAVMAMLYLGLFKLQETAMLYQVQRVASEGSLMVSSPGYASLTGNGSMLDGKNIDWSEFPEGEAIVGYYKAYHKDASTLYRELSGLSELSEKNAVDKSARGGELWRKGTEHSIRFGSGQIISVKCEY